MKYYKVQDCFISKIFGYRDSDLDNWLPKGLPVIKDGEITVYKIKSGQTFMDMIKDNGLTEKTLKDHCFSLLQVEEMLGRDDSRLLKTGYANFFPITDSEDFFVLSVFWRVGRWDVSVYRLDYDYEWLAGNRLFLRNLKLGDSDTLTLAIETCKKAGYQVSKIL